MRDTENKNVGKESRSSSLHQTSSQKFPSDRPLRIVIDMQGAQSESRFRGIGRYVMSFASAVIRNRGEHEIFLALSGLFPETIEPIRAAFDTLLPQENIRVWHAPGTVREDKPNNALQREAAELIREAFIASLQPDLIHISSLFEGYIDDAVTSIGRFDICTPVSVTLYDLIPLLNKKDYLEPNPSYSDYYMRKVEHLKQAECYLAISDFTLKEGQQHLPKEGKQFVNVSTAIEPYFRQLQIDETTKDELYQEIGLSRPFILYSGGADERKNLSRLIEAYATIPRVLRQNHQLLFVGKMAQGHIGLLKQIADAAGLRRDELIFSGYICDDKLIQLYNLCQLYVFPSWHEGFGLPGLEAMACGAPVIGANTSSLPEVIGLDEALFDPFEVTSIAAKMKQALTDNDFRARLRKHGLQQSRRFNWEETAKRAINTWETLSKFDKQSYLESSTANARLISEVSRYAGDDEEHLVALASCIAVNQSSGIERQLLVDISELSQRDAATGVQRVVRSYLKWLLQSPPSGFRVEPVYATIEEGYRYARKFTQRFLGLDNTAETDDPVRSQRGDIFFGLDMQHHVQLAHREFYQHLQQEGVIVKFMVYDLLPIQLTELFKDSEARQLHEQWLIMIATTDGAVCISKATRDALIDWAEKQSIICSPYYKANWVHLGADIDGSQPSKGLPEEAPIVLDTLRQRLTFLCVSTMEPRKRQEQILDAVEKLWESEIDVNLVFVGQEGWKIESLIERLQAHAELHKRLFWLRGISDEYLEKIYAASTCMIAASLNEGFGLSLIEAARHGVPIIARDIPVFREVAGDYAYYFNGETSKALAEALEVWLQKYQINQHQPSSKMPWYTWDQSNERLKEALIYHNAPRRQLLVDISELVQRDARTGIQRVVRSVLKEWLLNPPMGYRVEPVYATLDQGYRYARQFSGQFMGATANVLQDDPIEYVPGDLFFVLDLQPQVQLAKKDFYQSLRGTGCTVKFMVFDLLCVLMPHFFPPGSGEGFCHWLEVVAESDGAVCISRTVSDTLKEWIHNNLASNQRDFSVEWFHLGADIDKSDPTKGLPTEAEFTLKRLSCVPTFLMVGTLEPRKGHDQVLCAFELLWKDGNDFNLVVVGKQGWMAEKTVERLIRSSQKNKRLFWLESASDEYLEKVYTVSTCLIAASYGEGFGLPIIEAASKHIPIMARNIPVFREVGKDAAYYFDADSPSDIYSAIMDWMEMYNRGNYPKPERLSWATWEDSVKELNSKLL